MALTDTMMEHERRKRGRIRPRPPSWGAASTFDDREFSSAEEQRNCVRHAPGSDCLALRPPPAEARRTDDASLPDMCVNFGPNQAGHPDLSHVLGLGRRPTLCMFRPRFVFTAAAAAAVLLGLLAPVRTSATPVGPALALATPPAAAPDAVFALDPLGGQRSAELEAAPDGGRRRLASTVCPTCPNLARSCSSVGSYDATLLAPACITSQSSKITTHSGGHARLAVDGNTDQDYNNLSVTHTIGGESGSWEVTLEAQNNKLEEIVIYGRCCYPQRLVNLTVEVLDSSDAVVATRMGPSTFPPNPTAADFVFTFDLSSDGIIGRKVRVSNDVSLNEPLSLAEVEVYGRPASTVCPTCPNLARFCSDASADPTLGAPACKTTLNFPITYGTPSNTYYGYYGVDGNTAGAAFQTTGSGFREWNVTFESSHNIIEEVFVYNLPYSGSGINYASRLNGAKLEVVDVNDNVVASRTLTGDPGLQVYTFTELPVGSRVSINKIVENGQNLHVKEVEVYGRAVNRVFVTSETYQANLGGISGADNKCQARAAAAGLSGTYMAWVSITDSSSNPATNPAGRFEKSLDPYAVADGTQIASQWSTLVDGSLDSPINRDEFGALVDTTDTNTTRRVWTGTGTAGTRDYYHCLQWISNAASSTAHVGFLDAVDSKWTQKAQRVGCDTKARLYCFEQRQSLSTNAPSNQPSTEPSAIPSLSPSAAPSLSPSAGPSSQPSSGPSAGPTLSSFPSTEPSAGPTVTASSQPSMSSQPSSDPTFSALPSSQPSAGPTLSAAPSSDPSVGPTLSSAPSSTPSVAPSSPPTALDSDNDGIPDSSDQCPFEGGHVDDWGCPIDTDNDGIADCSSDLHPTPSGCDFDPWNQATFNPSACCNLGWDRCISDTPAGASVQDTAYTNSLGETIEPGCTSDEDGDGVVDGLDQCPNTTQVEKELAALANGKMTLYTTGTYAGCAILNETVWDSIFLDVLTNSDSIVSDPGLEAVFAVDPTMTNIQEARVVADGGTFEAESIARFTVLDPKCIHKYDDVTQSGDTLFTITPYLNDTDRYAGQIPEGTVLLSADIKFNAALLTQSPLWELEYPFSIGTVACCIRLELLSEDGDVQATHEVVSITRYNMNQDFAVEDSEMADVVREQASEAIEWVDVHYPLTACQCDYFDVCLDNDPTSPTFNGGVLGQGDELKICIYFDDTDGPLPESYVKIADIKTFTCNKEGTSLIHMPIGDNRYVNGDGLTSVKINNGDATDPKGRLVQVGTILPPAFFDREPGTAACEGIVQYDFVQGENIFSKRMRQRVLIEAAPPALEASPPAPESRLPDGSAKSVFNVEIGLAAAWQDPAIFAGTSTIRFSRGFLYGIMIMFASVAMLLVARPGSYRAFWRRLPCSKYEVKLETNRAVITKTCFTTAVDEPPVAHIFVHENVHEQDETYTQMSSSQFGLSAVEVGSSIMMPPVKHEQKKRNSLDFFKNKPRHDGDDLPSSSPRSSSKRRPSMDFFKRNSREDVMAEPKHAESSGRSVHFMID